MKHLCAKKSLYREKYSDTTQTEINKGKYNYGDMYKSKTKFDDYFFHNSYHTELLELFCNPGANVHGKIQREYIREDLSDEVVGLNALQLDHFFTNDAWLLIKEKSKPRITILSLKSLQLLSLQLKSKVKSGSVACAVK